ncbi:MAG: hypothetical protein KGR26_01625 [Cyanobacteria bacterium REEB65]|nr:hypothetical protein [Cyanobacteria bacterium REEB65]
MRRRPKSGSLPGGYQEPPAAQPLGDEEEEFNQRATFYFSDEQLLKLEVVMLRLRTEQRLKVGKSEIMRAALEFILEDYDRHRENCWLVRRVTGKP